jgi:hypothetical protein
MVLLGASLLAQPANAATTWGPAQTLSAGASTTATDPRLLVSADGQKMLSIWVRRTSTTTGVVLGARSTDAGATWTPTASITPSDQDIYRAEVVGNKDLSKVTVAWGTQTSATSATLSTRISTTLGDAWTSVGTVTTTMKPFDFDLAASSNGTIVHAAWVAAIPPPAPSNTQAIQTSVSSNAGGNWAGAKTLSSTSGSASSPRLTTSTDGSRATAVWANGTTVPQRIDGSYTSNSGQNWASAQTINTPNSAAFPAELASSANGIDVAATWEQWDANTKRIIRVATSTNGGATWSPIRSLSPDGIDSSSANIFSSATLGRLAVVWGDPNGAYVRVRPDGASDWNPTIKIGGRSDQQQVTGSENGNTLAVVWRSIPDLALMAATSTDGGITWTTQALPAVPEARHPEAAISGDGQVLSSAWTVLKSGQWLVQAAAGPRLVPDASVTPGSLDFGAVPVGSTADQVVTVTNTGLGSLKLSGFTLSGSDRFSLAANTCATALPPGAACQITVRVTPAAGGALSGSLTVLDNTATGSRTISLAGSGTVQVPEGTVPVPEGTVPVPDPKQIQKPADSKGLPPKSIKRKGITVVTGRNALTNAGERLTTKVKVKAPKKQYRIVRGKQGKVSVRTFGTKLKKVVITQSAPETATHTAYRLQATYRKGKRG